MHFSLIHVAYFKNVVILDAVECFGGKTLDNRTMRSISLNDQIYTNLYYQQCKNAC